VRPPVVGATVVMVESRKGSSPVGVEVGLAVVESEDSLKGSSPVDAGEVDVTPVSCLLYLFLPLDVAAAGSQTQVCRVSRQ